MEPKSRWEEGQMLLIDKPFNWTSFGVVREVRNLLRVKKVGHAGTLDPRATGLLIVCTGKFTRKISEFVAKEKEYTGTITIGSSTPTFDLESEPFGFREYRHLTREQIIGTTHRFLGEIMQVPPIYSAIKQDGKRVYEMARKGMNVIMEPRKIHIHQFDITHVELPLIEFRVVCSTGTYIRSLASDFGEALGCGGHLSSLCRTRIGEFSLEKALSLRQLEEMVKYEMQGG